MWYQCKPNAPKMTQKCKPAHIACELSLLESLRNSQRLDALAPRIEIQPQSAPRGFLSPLDFSGVSHVLHREGRSFLLVGVADYA